jgi:hypothetical protein
LAGIGAFAGLDLLPVGQHVVGAAHLDTAEHVGMAADHLL